MDSFSLFFLSLYGQQAYSRFSASIDYSCGSIHLSPKFSIGDRSVKVTPPTTVQKTLTFSRDVSGVVLSSIYAGPLSKHNGSLPVAARSALGTTEHEEVAPIAIDHAEFMSEYRRHFDRKFLKNWLASLCFDIVGDTTIAGQKCILFWGTKENAAEIQDVCPGNRFLIAGDIASGLILSIASYLDSIECWSSVVTRIQFDEQLVRPNFIGGLTRSVAGAMLPMHGISLAEAQRRFSGLLYVSDLLPMFDATQCRISYYTATTVFKAERVVFTFVGDHIVFMIQAPAYDAELHKGLRWSSIDQVGIPCCISDPKTPDGYRIICFTLTGAVVYVASSLSPSEIIRIGTSLKPFVDS